MSETSTMSPIGPTPLRLLFNCSESFGCEVFGKLEIYNLTGSHKDRESEEILKYALSQGIRGVAIASTGNAAISLAAYSYLHHLQCHVYLPERIAAERLAQIQAYCPIIHLSKGGYEEAIRECEKSSNREGLLNCNPGARAEKINGDMKIGIEIADQLKPSHLICPTNNGTLLTGVWKGLKASGVNTRVFAAFAKSTRLAEGIAGFHRIEEPELSNCLAESDGEAIEVSDVEIGEAARLLLRDGMVVEGAAAASVACLNHLKLSSDSKVCSVITGNGLKFPNSVKEMLAVPECTH